MPYRESRNIEVSTKNFIVAELVTAGWTNINTYLGWEEVIGSTLPAITIRSGITNHNKVEMGSFSTRREVNLLIDVFAKNEGQKLDLKDFLVSILKASWIYNEYTVTNHVSSHVANGEIICINLTETPVNLDTDKSNLDIIDRYRSLIMVTVTTGEVEI